MRYATRNHVFTSATTWTLELEPPCLRVEEEGKAPAPPRSWPLSDIAHVRLEFSPTRTELNRFRCRITFRSGERRDFFNRTYAGFMDFRDTSAAYVEFVRALHAAIAAQPSPGPQAPPCRFVAGTTPWLYAGNLAIIAFVLVGLVGISWFLFTIGRTWLVILKFLIVLAFLPTLFTWAARNRPRGYTPIAIPPEVLPKS